MAQIKKGFFFTAAMVKKYDKAVNWAVTLSTAFTTVYLALHPCA